MEDRSRCPLLEINRNNGNQTLVVFGTDNFPVQRYYTVESVTIMIDMQLFALNSKQLYSILALNSLPIQSTSRGGFKSGFLEVDCWKVCNWKRAEIM